MEALRGALVLRGMRGGVHGGARKFVESRRGAEWRMELHGGAWRVVTEAHRARPGGRPSMHSASSVQILPLLGLRVQATTGSLGYSQIQFERAQFAAPGASPRVPLLPSGCLGCPRRNPSFAASSFSIGLDGHCFSSLRRHTSIEASLEASNSCSSIRALLFGLIWPLVGLIRLFEGYTSAVQFTRIAHKTHYKAVSH